MITDLRARSVPPLQHWQTSDIAAMDSDQSDDEARAFEVPDGPPDFSIESFDDVTAEEFLRRVAYVIANVFWVCLHRPDFDRGVFTCTPPTVYSYEARRLPKVSVATNLDARRFDASRTPQLPPQIATKLRAARGGPGGGDGCSVANASRAQSATGTSHAAMSACIDAANDRADEASETWAADFTAGFVDLRQVCRLQSSVWEYSAAAVACLTFILSRHAFVHTFPSQAVVRHSLLQRQRRGSGSTLSDGLEAAHHCPAAASAISASTAAAMPRHSTPALPKSLSARDWRDFCLGRVARRHTALGGDATASVETQQRRRGDVFEKICDDDGDDDGDADGNADPDAGAAATGDVGDAGDDGDSDQDECILSVDAAAAAAVMSVPAHSPLLSILVRMDAVAIDTALNALIAYLADASPTDEALDAMAADATSSTTTSVPCCLPATASALSAASERTDSAKAATVEMQQHASSLAPSPPSFVVAPCPLTAHLAAWLYALLATIDKPLLADTAAALRALHRRCARLLSAYGHGHGRVGVRGGAGGMAPPSVPPTDHPRATVATVATACLAPAVSAAVGASANASGGDEDARMATTARLGLLMTIVDRCFQQRS